MASRGVPIDLIESVESVNSHCEEVESNVRDVLAACDPDVLAEIPPLDRAYIFLTLAKAAATLYAMQLQFVGESVEDHPFKKEMERLELYTSKVEYYIDMSTARPTTKINARAATRFLEHSLPDLTPQQKSEMREISRGERSGIKSQEARGNKKKRKHDLSGRQSVAAAAVAFLAETSKELFEGNSLQEQIKDEVPEEGEIGED
ncbi:hypothetical protein SUGI_1038030 [Cryptomeria japonica]|uniref:uncharacterized protein LOC131075867 n=1 Tax=Cryptomeria japonica TaxID=3369 RepID=UPI002414C8FD|nr:uncharacterized protein LOC131075867 [Cryptomeria japonica]GLJ49190.1 hypothetical protein SUGI_1038030 [Cryptomeria japonica]